MHGPRRADSRRSLMLGLRQLRRPYASPLSVRPRVPPTQPEVRAPQTQLLLGRPHAVHARVLEMPRRDSNLGAMSRRPGVQHLGIRAIVRV